MINHRADEVKKELLESLKNRQNHGGSYGDSPDWIKKKESNNKFNQKKDNKCFQYAVTVVLNHEEIGKILKE